MDLSVIIPIKDEHANITPLHDRLRAALDPLPLDYEVVFVDDGSRDGSSDALRHAAHTDPRLKVLFFSRISDTRPQSLQAPRAFST